MLALFAGGSVSAHPVPVPDDPLGDDDLQLGLALAYELSYRGLPGVRDTMEWEPAVLATRRILEEAFEAALRRRDPAGARGTR